MKEYTIHYICVQQKTQIMYSFIKICLQTQLLLLFFLFFFWGGRLESLQKCVLNDILFHIMIQFKWNFAFNLWANLRLPTL